MHSLWASWAPCFFSGAGKLVVAVAGAAAAVVVDTYIIAIFWYFCQTRRPIFAHLQATPRKKPLFETTKQSITLDRKPD